MPSLPPRVDLTCLCIVGILLVLPGLQPTRSQPAQLSEESQISMITILPGDPVYTFAGHSALRVRDPVHNVDRLYNYGTFNFNDPLFIPKFTYGYLRYHLSVTPYAPTVGAYKQQGRPVIEQQLQLSRSQRTAVYRFLQHNARPENRYYQYDFFFDNCSTRIRDVLEETLGTDVDFSGAPSPDQTFRQLLDPYVASRPALDLGFDLGLGLPADREASAREAMFLPEHLMRGFNHATVSINGERRPLVSRTDTVQWISNYSATTPVFDWPFALSVGFLLLVLGWTMWQAYAHQRPDGLGDALLLAAVGLAGVVICYLWFVSTYAVTDYNLNILWAWPTHLGAAYLLLRRPSNRGLPVYLAGATAVSCIILLGWNVWPQNFHRAIFPLVLGVGIRTGWLTVVLSGIHPSVTSAPLPATSPSA